jgi:PAS domain S-box-containing protein
VRAEAGRAARQEASTGVVERVEVDQKLGQNEELFRLLVDNVVDYAIFLLDPDGYVMSWNPGAARIKGYTAREIIGRHFSTFYPPEDREAGKPERLLAIARSHGRVEDEGWRVRKDGARFWADVVITALWDAGHNLRGFAKVTRDLSERRRVEEELALQSEELARSNSDLEQFAYVASHDLQEPLRAVVSYLQLLSRRYEGQLDERADKYIHYATEGAHRMQALIQDLLAYARVGRKGSAFGPTDSSHVLALALAHLRAAVESSEACVTAGDLPEVVADASQLTQLFQNLIGNAIKFRGPEPPRIHLAAAREDDHWHFTVQDNGIGIEPEYLERIFTIFQRLHTREEYPGTGIGLAICKRIVERHGGAIWAESAPGRGTIMHFTLSDHLSSVNPLSPDEGEPSQ